MLTSQTITEAALAEFIRYHVGWGAYHARTIRESWRCYSRSVRCEGSCLHPVAVYFFHQPV